MSSGKIVSSVLLPRDELFGVEQLAVSSGPDLIDHSRFQIQEDGPGHVLARARLAEERVEGVMSDSSCCITAQN